MKKKIFLVLMCVVLGMVFAGCDSAVGEDKFASRKAWQMIETASNRETINFSGVRYRYEGNQKVAIAGGNLNFRLVESKITDTEDDTKQIEVAELVTSFSLVHNENSSFDGETDEIDSTVLFRRNTLSPISSQKTVSLPSYTKTKGYTTSTDYEANKTTITPRGGEAKEYTLKSGEYFDNEMLYHLVRAFPKLETSKTYSFDILTPFDVYDNNKFFTHPIRVEVASDLVKMEVPKSIYDIAIPKAKGDGGKFDEDGTYKIECLALKISLDTEKSGAPFYMYISDLNFIDNDTIRQNQETYKDCHTSRVPIKIVTTEYDTDSLMNYTNEYTITSYSTIL